MGFLPVLFIVVNSFLGQTVCKNISFPSFKDEDYGLFMFDNSDIALGALQVTAETRNSGLQYSPKNRFGRVVYNTAYKLFHGSSFNASFVFNIVPDNGTGNGEGMAFFISSAKDIKDGPVESHGHWLGLFNSSTDGQSSNQMVAIEFDTRKSDGTNDPDGNHVGINVNGINSKEFVSLKKYGIDLMDGAKYNITAWIQYSGSQQRLDVYVAKSPNPMPLQSVLSYPIDLSKVLDPKVYFGFSASTGESTELNCVHSWRLWFEDMPSKPKTALVIALSLAAAVLFIAAMVIVRLFVMKYRKCRAELATILDALQKLPGHPREFKYKDLKKATHNFCARLQLGSGGFGAVYKAILPKEKTAVAVKRIFKDSKQGREEFISEISIINRLRHRNLVPLLGWCHDKGQLMMVYEYMPNGSLEKHIYRGLLDWEQRYNIVSGVASALFYLHEECEQQVIHRDLKASNIMLDSEYNARLGDFGLARLIQHNRTSYMPTNVAGTMGYIAPECFHTGRATVQSDVFGFGAVVLEVACGRPPKSGGDAPDLVGWVWKLYRENNLMEAADSRLAMPADSVANVNEDDIKCLLMVGLACSNPNPGDRPTMRQIKQILCRDMPPPYVPPFRPPFVWSHSFSDDSCFATTSVTTDTVLLRSMNSSVQSP